MTAIDIGGGAIDRGGNIGPGCTYIDRTNPADGTGNLTSVEIWALTSWNLSDCKVGTWDYPSSATNRDYETIGSVTAGSKQTFSGLNISVVTNDGLGIYYSAGYLENDTSGGGGIYYAAGDFFGGDISGAGLLADNVCSIYGTGLVVVTSTHPLLFCGVGD